MASFKYSAKEWAKIRPDGLPTTGFEEALLEYEEAKRKFARHALLRFYEELRASFHEVELARWRAIMGCGFRFPEVRDQLETADPIRERRKHHRAMRESLLDLLTYRDAMIRPTIPAMTQRIEKARLILERLAAAPPAGNSVADARRLLQDHGGKYEGPAALGAEWSEFMARLPQLELTFPDVMAAYHEVIEGPLGELNELRQDYCDLLDKLRRRIEDVDGPGA
ncbi:MAG TPA: hypothetical protein PLV92_15840 [Pirellulaceae bacterium]|nr:hypothetical protein [Pirellulaceae bacterium]